MRSRSALASPRTLGGVTFALVVGCNGAETPVPRPTEPLPEPNAAAPCVPVEGSVPIDLVGGSDTLLALFDDGTVWCFGNNRSGQCSDDLYDQQPLRLARLGCATQVAMGLTTGLAILRDGRVQSWGSERFETLGDGPGTATRPGQVGFVLLDEPARFVDVESQTAGAATASGRAHRWGDWLTEAVPQLVDTPVELDLRLIVELRVTSPSSCARDEMGRTFCWGWNRFGELARPDLAASDLPLEVALPEPAIQLAHLGLTVCALLESGRVFCWGSNFVGALGRGVGVAVVEQDHQPALVLVDEPLVGIAAGSDGACGWTAEGRVYCWGSNHIYRFWPGDPWPPSPLGDPSDGIPRRVPELEPARRVALMEAQICALGFDDRVRCRQPIGDPGRGQYAFEVEFEEAPREEDEDDPG